jgi:RNA polymerase sigma-70 factor, ECF subfamily
MTTLALELTSGTMDTRVLRARDGDLEAFNELVRESERLVYSICYRITGERTSAEDAAQEAFISAWRSIARVKPDSFRPWLFRIATNAAKSQLRKLRRRAETDLEAVAEREAAEPTPESVVLRRAVRDEIGAALSQLSQGQRDAVLLWHQAGLDYQEIASATRTTLGTVKSRLYRGRKHLSRLLSPGALAMT